MIRRLSAIIAVCLFSGCNTNPDPDRVISRYEQVHNQHDVGKELSLYTDDILFELGGTWVKQGKQAMKHFAEWDSTLDSYREFEILSEKKDTVYCRVKETNDWYRGIGMDTLVHDSVLVELDNYKIRKIKAGPSEEQRIRMSAALASIFSWSQMAGDTTINHLLFNNEFIYSKEAAASWKELLEKVEF